MTVPRTKLSLRKGDENQVSLSSVWADQHRLLPNLLLRVIEPTNPAQETPRIGSSGCPIVCRLYTGRKITQNEQQLCRDGKVPGSWSRFREGSRG